ncbi:rod shape-determining protein MreC [Sphingomonas canadensis]|uniref:Cell shape-determining protein MreC n=1 Tax=Sphingomonas canadensis TaxID=1219257 RepID=A0ABW3HC52_9SPHN|nr:rod shape-determining protein MreC [Sphingomonas canadensis]MCW3836655.1 rod shape-determining protein MreC [Sphingomonas canadensis]
MAPPRNRRPGFSRRAQYGLFLGYVGAIGGALVGAVLLLLSTFNPPAYAMVRGFFAELTTPVSTALAWVERGFAGIPGAVSEHFNVQGENERLRKEIETNRTLVDRARTLNQENRRLRQLLGLKRESADAVVAARLVSSTPTSTRRYAVLNAGSLQNVARGMPVREADGLIGRVIETSLNTSRVLLIVDSESSVPVRRTRDGLPALAKGRGDGKLDVHSASLTGVGFKSGDVFVTSGTGGLFPPNIPVAVIAKDARDTAEAVPAANPDALDFALVLKPFLDEPPPEHPAPGGEAPKAAPK